MTNYYVSDGEGRKNIKCVLWSHLYLWMNRTEMHWCPTEETLIVYFRVGLCRLESIHLFSSYVEANSWVLTPYNSCTKLHLLPLYGCESWTVKKADAEELMLLNCGVGEDS